MKRCRTLCCGALSIVQDCLLDVSNFLCECLEVMPDVDSGDLIQTCDWPLWVKKV